MTKYPTCNVAADETCRTRGSRRVTDTHSARIALAWKSRCLTCEEGS